MEVRRWAAYGIRYMRNTADQIKEYYRNHDDFNRYLTTSAERVSELSRFYTVWRKFFGHRVLDLACGGGVLGFVIEPRGHTYTGVDINSDMIESGRKHVDETRSRNLLILGDARSAQFHGHFDTVTILGNALIHFTASDLSRTLRNLKTNVHLGASFLIEYRDVVSMLYSGTWDKKYVQRRNGKIVVGVTKEIDATTGNIAIMSMTNGHKGAPFTHAIWSPFIVEAVLELSGWTLARRRSSPRAHIWTDAYILRTRR